MRTARHLVDVVCGVMDEHGLLDGVRPSEIEDFCVALEYALERDIQEDK